MTNRDESLEIRATSISRTDPPEFSICIPQYNRTRFLIEACKSLAAQSFKSFEVCISDDQSTDGGEDELIRFLRSSGMDFTYGRQITNRRYDGNLRGAIGMARGRYIFLLGNDDRLANCDTLERVHAQLISSVSVQVAITNYVELGSGRKFTRMPQSGLLGHGPTAAVQYFRNFSFVSGVILDTRAAQSWFTKKWDGSEMYQMYLGCRILASGGTLLGISEVCIEKDIQIAGEAVDSYASKKVRKKDCSPVTLPMGQIAPLVADAISPYLSERSLEETVLRIAARLFMFTYGYWLIEFRRVQGWRYAFSVYRGLAPNRALANVRLSWLKRSRLRLLYVAVGIAGLTIPVSVFRKMENLLYRLAKRSPFLSEVPARA